MIINDLDGYYIVFDTKNWNTELDTLIINTNAKVGLNIAELLHCYNNLLTNIEFYDIFSSAYKTFLQILGFKYLTIICIRHHYRLELIIRYQV